MLLPGVGEAGQRTLLASHAVVVGCGALGCEIADQLARAGVGTLTLIDRDVVEWTNLQRQRLFAERDAAGGTPKVEAAAARLAEINSGVRVNAIAADLNHRNAETLLLAGSPTVILDGTDNFATRYLVNDVAVKHGVAYVYAGAVATRGMQMTVLPGEADRPCLRCVFPEPPEPGSAETCDTAGVLGPAIATAASSQVTDAIKVMLDRRDLIDRTLFEFDLWANRRRQLRVARDPSCPCCVGRKFDALAGKMGTASAYLCGQNAVQIHPRGAAGQDDDEDTPQRVPFESLAARLAPHGTVTKTNFMLRVTLASERGDDGGPIMLSIFPDGRALVRGLRNPDRARVLYDRYVG